ncbi:VOC family protein, partial [Actinoplanes utahensis]
MTEKPVRFGGRHDVELVVVLDCSDLDRSATFWCGVLGYRAEPSSPGRYQQLMPPDGHGPVCQGELRPAAHSKSAGQ